MLTVATTGPDNPNKAVLPFAALKGSIGAADEEGYPQEQPVMFLMQEAVYLAHEDTKLEELKAVGLPPIADIVNFLLDYDFRMIVCLPCAEGRGIEEDDLIDCAVMGEGKDLAELSQQHEQTLTF